MARTEIGTVSGNGPTKVVAGNIFTVDDQNEADEALAEIAAHIASPTPHSAYDNDIQDLSGYLDNKLA